MAVIFAADDGVHGYELWISNGTADGTRLLKDIRAGTAGSAPGGFVSYDGKIVFYVWDEAQNRDLWITDGTEAGTQKLADVSSPFPYVRATRPVVVGDRLFFDAPAANGGYDLWVSDGTPAGTASIKPGAGNGMSLVLHTSSMGALGGKVFFAGNDGEHGTELWISDGTAAGTHFLKDLLPGVTPYFPGSSPSHFVQLGDKLFFTAHNPSGRHLYVTDGTAEGTVLFAELPEVHSGIERVGDLIYFTVTDESGTQAVWVSDGSVEGTHAADPDTLPIGLGAKNLHYAPFVLGDKLVYAENLGDDSYSTLWVTDGTATGTQRLGQDLVIANVVQAGHDIVLRVGDKLYFGGTDGHGTAGLWVTDGTQQGTQLVKELPGLYIGEHSNDFDIGPDLGNGKIAFAVERPGYGVELWVSDGSSDGTVPVTKISPGKQPNLLQPAHFTSINIAPSDIAITGVTIAENSAAGTIFGSLSASDLDLTDTHTFTLRNSAGGRFAIQGDKLVVADGLLLDYELKASHQITVRATDQGGKFVDKTFTIALNDVAAERVTGDARANVFDGGAGNDIISGVGGDDRIAGSGGNDTLFGGNGADTLMGGEGEDRLDGGAGADSLSGGSGSDLYWITSGDTISETAGSGVKDRVHASDMSLDLRTLGGGFIEQAVLKGDLALNLTGNAAANALWGNAGANVVNGKTGSDYLTGGAGNDTFAFDTRLSAKNVDLIVDFAKGDRIALDNAIFGKIGEAGTLKSAFFQTGKADDKDDFILYDKATGALFYDADGNGAGAAVKFAVVDTRPTLSAGDFLVI